MNTETQDYNKQAAMLAIIFFCYENNVLLLLEQFVQILSFVHFFLISYSEIIKLWLTTIINGCPRSGFDVTNSPFHFRIK